MLEMKLGDGIEKWVPFISRTHSIQDAESYIEAFLERLRNGTGYLYGLWDATKIIGILVIMGIDENAKTAEIGCMIEKEYEGKGIIKKSCRILIEFLFNELSMQKILICCDDRNERSINTATRLGFIHRYLICTSGGCCEKI